MMGDRFVGDFGKQPATFDCGDWAAMLRCPDCGDTWLHQGKVEVFDRFGDHKDSPGIRTSVEGGEVERDDSDSAMDGNPSWRRDGVVIHFYCEMCNGYDGDSEADKKAAVREKRLAIFQHKGQTFLAWEPE